jgi:hypothetical protein
MEKLRQWGFPITLIAAWMFAAAYTVSLLIAPPERATPIDGNRPAATETARPLS